MIIDYLSPKGSTSLLYGALLSHLTHVIHQYIKHVALSESLFYRNQSVPMTAPDLESTSVIIWNHWYNRTIMSCTIQWPTSVTYSQQRWTTYLQKDIELVEKKLPKPSGNGKHEKNLEVYIHHLFIQRMESCRCDATTHTHTYTHIYI